MRVTKISLILLAAITLVLGGCQDEDRPLSYNKGVYAGKPDKALTSAQVEALRHRGGRQKD